MEFTGGNIVFAVPGTSPRQLTANSTVIPLDSSCAYLYFCGWENNNFTGSKFSVEACGVYKYIGWYTATGSWKNNQSAGTRAGFYDFNHHLLSYTPPAYSQSKTGNWMPVYWVKPC